MKNEELNKEMEQLACLDYMVAKLENAYRIFRWSFLFFLDFIRPVEYNDMVK